MQRRPNEVCRPAQFDADDTLDFGEKLLIGDCSAGFDVGDLALVLHCTLLCHHTTMRRDYCMRGDLRVRVKASDAA